MDVPSSELLTVIYALLPGFVAAWIFYGLTAHPRLGPFERVVQALIFTGIAQALVAVIRGTGLLIGQWKALVPWTESTSLVASMIVAAFLGIGVAICANKDWFHTPLRHLGLTQRTSYPSEWFSAFCRGPRYVVLHLSGGRRLYGWPYEWPDSPDAGHFAIVQPEWLLDDNTRVLLREVEKVLVRAKDVEMVEFVRGRDEADQATTGGHVE